MMEYRNTFKYKIEIVDESLPRPKLISYFYNKEPAIYHTKSRTFSSEPSSYAAKPYNCFLALKKT
ncbi:hypothetical protein AAEX37_00824 [Oligella sp. MSHR50489EDL]